MSINSALLRYGAKDHYFRAVLCRMCRDVQDGSNALHKYEEQFPSFADSRECKLLQVNTSLRERTASLFRPLFRSNFS